MARTAFNIDPVQAGKVAQNSPDDAHFNKGLSYHLVSEFGQNTVDAFRLLMTSGTAHLRITRKLVDRAALVEFDIETVERHAKACEGEMGDFTVSDKVEMLLVEDASGGLDGHVTATDNDTKSALGRYLFEKGTGIHGKDGRSGGRFGLGSTVGTFISEVRAMYVHSMRRGGSTVASARLSQPTHTLDGLEYSGDARLGHIGDDGEWRGILYGEVADRLAAACGMSRPDGQPGLSCAIPYPSAQFDFESIFTGAVIYQYFQIGMNFIRIEIVDEVANRYVMLDRDSLREFFESEAFADLKSSHSKKTQDLMEMARTGFGFVTGIDSALAPVKIANGEKLASTPEMRKTLASGKVLHVSRALSAEHKRNGAIHGEINVFIRKMPVESQGVCIKVRDGIAVTSKAVSRGMATLTIARDDDIANLIGDGENPSHSEWSSAQARKRGWTISAVPVFSAFANTASEIVSSLAGHEEESDRFSLAAFFPMPGSEAIGQSNLGVEDEQNDETGEPIIPSDGPADILVYNCDPKTSTLVISLSKAAKATIMESGPLHLEITAEYDKSPRNAGALVGSNGFFNVLRGALQHSVEITPKGQCLTLPQAMADLKITIKIDMIRDINVRCALIDNNDEDIEEAA